MSFLSKVGTAFPSSANLLKHIESSNTPLNEIRSNIWSLRTEYWYRKISGYPNVWNNAKADFCHVLKLASNPGLLTVRELYTVSIFTLQFYACFKLGEISSRKSVAGYSTDKINGYHYYSFPF